jgi:transposase
MSRRYNEEFKEEALKLINKQGYSQSEAARNLGISSKNINRWLKAEQMKEKGTAKLSKGEKEELIGLRKEVARLKMEREILKKAAAFFAKEQE